MPGGCVLAYKRLAMSQSFYLHTFYCHIFLNGLAAKRRVTMSKFFTYEDRLTLQKYLKESQSFKEIARRLDKNPTTISREVRKHFSEVATGYPGFPYNACRTASTAGKNRSAARTVRGLRQYTANSARSATTTAQTSLRKSVRQDSGCLMSAMAANKSVNVLC